MSVVMPFYQQGTSTWNYAVNYGGLVKYSISDMIVTAQQLKIGFLDLLNPLELQKVQQADNHLKVSSLVQLNYDRKGNPPFLLGPNNPDNHSLFYERTNQLIFEASRSEICDTVTVFFGDERANPFAKDSGKISVSDGIKHAIYAFTKVITFAEQNGVTLVLEMLNSKKADHPMKGHPGYQGNNLDYCIDVIEGVGSPNLKLLFDIYHVGRMHQPASVPQWIRELRDHIGLVHTAGHEDRQETCDDKTVDQKECMRALQEIGYKGAVIHEYLPKRHDITQALQDCCTFLECS